MHFASYFQRFVSSFMRSHIKSERGANLAEYAILVALIALVCFGAATFFGGNVETKFDSVGSSLA